VYGPIHVGAKVTGVAAQHTMDRGFLFANKSSGFENGEAYYYAYTAEAEL
jgi:hypothetical protein